jgi:hypothetical protein
MGSKRKLATEPGLLLWAHWASGFNRYWAGEFASARTLLEQGLSLYDSQQPPSAQTSDSRAASLLYTSLTLWYLGYPDQALKRIREALALAQGLSPHNVAWTLDNAAWFYLLRREWQLARELAEAAITLMPPPPAVFLWIMPDHPRPAPTPSRRPDLHTGPAPFCGEHL